MTPRRVFMAMLVNIGISYELWQHAPSPLLLAGIVRAGLSGLGANSSHTLGTSGPKHCWRLQSGASAERPMAGWGLPAIWVAPRRSDRRLSTPWRIWYRHARFVRLFISLEDSPKESHCWHLSTCISKACPSDAGRLQENNIERRISNILYADQNI